MPVIGEDCVPFSLFRDRYYGCGVRTAMQVSVVELVIDVMADQTLRVVKQRQIEICLARVMTFISLRAL
jgi:hypothetical protein